MHIALEKLSVQTAKAQNEPKESPKKSLIPIRTISAKQKPTQKPVDYKIETRDFLSNLKTDVTTPAKRAKSVPSLKSEETIAIRKSKETLQLFAKNETTRWESESESESESERNVKIKPSATSTLGQYSTTR